MNPLPPWDGTAHNFSLLMITHTDVLGLCAYYIGRVRAKSQMHSTITTTISKRIYFRFLRGESVWSPPAFFDSESEPVFGLSSGVGASFFFDG